MDHPPVFRTTVHGTIFGGRAARIEALTPGTPVLLIPDPPMQENPAVWVHSVEGDPLGHLPADINSWLVEWILLGGSASAEVIQVGGCDVPSWKRLLIEVRCKQGAAPGT